MADIIDTISRDLRRTNAVRKAVVEINEAREERAIKGFGPEDRCSDNVLGIPLGYVPNQYFRPQLYYRPIVHEAMVHLVVVVTPQGLAQAEQRTRLRGLDLTLNVLYPAGETFTFADKIGKEIVAACAGKEFARRKIAGTLEELRLLIATFQLSFVKKEDPTIFLPGQDPDRLPISKQDIEIENCDKIDLYHALVASQFPTAYRLRLLEL